MTEKELRAEAKRMGYRLVKNPKSEKFLPCIDTEEEADMEAVFARNTRNTNNVIETEEITSVITRLRSNRDSNLTRYTSNEGKESHVIVSQKDRGYFQALDDIEKALLKKEKTDVGSKM